MVSFTKKEQMVILILVVGIIAVIGYNILKKDNVEVLNLESNSNDIQNTEIVEESTENSQKNEDRKAEEDRLIMVDISGQVNNPGVIVLKEGSRVIDAVEKAGGLTEEADRDRINLSKKISDEEKIYIPKIGENIEINPVNTSSQEHDITSGYMININTASKQELESLPGIGPVLAERIIEYRERNSFKSINEILNVNGIGEKKFEDIKGLIIVR